MAKLLIILLFLIGCSSERTTVSTWYDNGNPEIEITTKDGEIIVIKKYFENGNIQAIANRKDGKLHGLSIVYDIDGNVLLEEFYDNGMIGKDVQILSPKG